MIGGAAQADLGVLVSSRVHLFHCCAVGGYNKHLLLVELIYLNMFPIIIACLFSWKYICLVFWIRMKKVDHIYYGGMG